MISDPTTTDIASTPASFPGNQAGALPKIRIRGLRKAFGDKLVLDGVDLDIMPATSMVIIGGSGSGKSVLLKCILGLDANQMPALIEIDGQDLAKLDPARPAKQSTGPDRDAVSERRALFDSLPVWENVTVAHCWRKHEALRACAGPCAGRVPSSPRWDWMPTVGDAVRRPSFRVACRSVSGLARAIAANPQILFFDEPTTGLDPIMGAVIDGLIVDCVKRMGSTAVAITHDMASAQTHR